MQPHEERVVAEKQELDLKLGKLSDFLATSPIFRQLDDEDRSLLTEQFDTMRKYSDILGSRIARFKE